MSTLKSIIFEVIPEGTAEEYYETAEALRDLDRLSRAFSELDSLQEEVRSTREKITDDREVFPIARELDGKMRTILNELFGKEICEPLFGSVNLFASSGGLPLWANLLLAITDEVQGAMKGELDAREKRIAKYVEKYTPPLKRGGGSPPG